MYVCICNNITSKKIEKAVSNGISHTKHIYSYYNCSPKCGKCISYMEDLINNKIHFQTLAVNIFIINDIIF